MRRSRCRVSITSRLLGDCVLTMWIADDKQARLLSQEAGHFSLVRALHMADFITELNGTLTCPKILFLKRYLALAKLDLLKARCARSNLDRRISANEDTRLLRHNVCLLLPPLLHPNRPHQPHESLLGVGLHPAWPVLRLHGRQGREVEKEGFSYGTGT